MNNKLAYVCIPKTGSFTMKQYCAHNNISTVWHDRDIEKFVNRANEFDRFFCFIRTPIHRFISAYSYLKQGGRNRDDKEDWKIVGAYGDINSFVKYGLKEINQIHFKPQKHWLDLLPTSRLTCLQFEFFNSDLKQFSEDNSFEYVDFGVNNKSEHVTDTLTPESRELLLDFYKEDLMISLGLTSGVQIYNKLGAAYK